MNARYELRLVELLTEIRDDQRRVLRLLEERRPPAPRDAHHGPLLRAIFGHVGSRAFVCAELIEHARKAEKDKLAAAIVTATGTLEAKRLGKLLKRLEMRDLDGLYVKRLTVEREGVVWAVEVCENQIRKYAIA